MSQLIYQILSESSLLKLRLFYIKVRWNIQMKYHVFMNRRDSFLNIENMDILYENNDAIIISKAHDLIINHATPHTFFLTLAHQLFWNRYWKADESAFHKFRFCHQLDHATSGIICIGYNKKGCGRIAKCFENRSAKKQYLALVWGHLERKRFNRCMENGHECHRVDEAIGGYKSKMRRNMMFQCTQDDPKCQNAKPAVTDFLVLEEGSYRGQPASKLLLAPLTGRTHQLRVHCRFLGHSIIGDCIYGTLNQDGVCSRMMLHAYRLKLPPSAVTSKTKDLECLNVVSEDPFFVNNDPEWLSERTFCQPEDYCHQ